MSESNFDHNQPWLSTLEEPHQALIKQSWQLFDREVSQESSWHDYSFVIFPMAKAYEGFLKSWLMSQDLLDQTTFRSRRFRIGRALNPDVPHQQRDQYWLYDDVAHQCGQPLAQQLWEVWLNCRNHTFHFFPDNGQALSLEDAKMYLNMMGDAIAAAVACSKVASSPGA